MRITGWRVDGYGVLTDHTVADLPEGITIVHGPNEAGKSTLLAFVRHVLFGFPDRRRRESLHEPMFGGRHGGALFLADESGVDYVIERHADRKEPVVTGPRGDLGELGLRRLLGESDAALFSSVFAFGLDELASLQALEADQVRDRVFTAGVLGAGRSATQAARQLEQRRGDLVRPRKNDARANALQARLAAIDQRLREARIGAREYPQKRQRLDEIERSLAEALSADEESVRRLGELERLRDSWPVVRELADAESALDDLAPSEAEALTLAGAPRVRRLLDGAALAEEWHARREELWRERERLGERLAMEKAALAGLVAPPALSEAALLALDVDDGHQRLDELVALHATASALRQAKDDELAARRRDLDDAEARLLATVVPRGARPEVELSALDAAVGELARWVRERDRLEAAAAEAARDERVARLEDAASTRTARPLAVSLLVIAALLVAAGAFAVARRADTAAVVALGAAAILTVFIVRSARPAQKLPEDRAETTGSQDLARANGEVARRAVELELPERASIADVESLAQLVHRELAERSRIDAGEDTLLAARKAVALAEDALAAALANEQATRTRVDEVAALFEIEAAVGPERLPATLRTLARAGSLARAVEQLDEDLSRLDESLDLRRSEMRAVSGALGLDGEVDHPLDELAELVDAAEERASRRRALEERVRTASARLADTFGEGATAARLRAELMTGAVLGWEEERNRLNGERSDVGGRLERLFSERADARAALDALLSSDAVAELELERTGIEAELEQVMKQWATLGLARALLVETLTRYERERQPEVIRRAGELFAEVTDGRYLQLVAREDPDGGRSHGLEVLSAAGSRVDSGDLSRGTAEQLYLCLRLALASTFADRSVRLPLVLDDVLVNFDPERAAAIAVALAKTAAEHQVLAITCHPHVVELMLDAAPGARVVELARR